MSNEEITIPLSSKLFQNVDEASLTSTYAAQENCYVTETGALARFPGLTQFVDLGGASPTFMTEFNSYMIAVNQGGETFRIDQNGNVTRIQGEPVLGGHRTTFVALKDRLLMAAGAQIVAYDGKQNEILSQNAPLATHIGAIDNYVLANEFGSDRFFYSDAGDPYTWNDLNVFAATTQPDDISALQITPFGEILVAGPKSVEQFERLLTGTTPFYRRWALGAGICEPYTLCYDDNASWGLNYKYEFTRMSGQVGQSVSEDVGQAFQGFYGMGHLETHEAAWALPLNVSGQKFIIFQSPFATNKYGTKGVTYAIDIRANKWCELFGWDNNLNVPTIWPGCSVAKIWGKTYVGGQGKIYECTGNAYTNAGNIQRIYFRTPMYIEGGRTRINKLMLWGKRGTGTNTSEAYIMMRSNQDGKGFTHWQRYPLGRAGDNNFFMQFPAQGVAYSWQFEFMVSDNCDVQLRELKADITKLSR